MKYILHDLGQRSRGDVVEVSLTRAANVRLLDSSNYSKYKNGRQHRYYGGLARQSPARVVVPHSGRWYVTIDMQGLEGSTSASVKVIPASATRPLPAMRPTGPLAELAENILADSANTPKSYDVFISHATEDKETVVRALAHSLRDAGLTVWFDEFELRVGDSLRRSIDQGIASSRFGVVVVSPQFITKGWTNHELDGLMVRSIDGSQKLLPIWHNISRDEVIAYSPSLADKVALNTATSTLTEIAKEIAEAVAPRGSTE